MRCLSFWLYCLACLWLRVVPLARRENLNQLSQFIQSWSHLYQSCTCGPFSWMCISRWDWAREGWEDENHWGYQIAMDTEPSNDSCWKANWWQGRMNACICCMLVGFWNLPLVLSFENLCEAKERDGTHLAVMIKKKLIEQAQSDKCQTDKCQAVRPKNDYKRIFHKKTVLQKTIEEPVIAPKRKVPNPPEFHSTAARKLSWQVP